MELVANKELNLHIRPDGSTKYNAEPDFKFVVIENSLSVENEFSLSEGLMLQAYFRLKDLDKVMRRRSGWIKRCGRGAYPTGLPACAAH